MTRLFEDPDISGELDCLFRWLHRDELQGIPKVQTSPNYRHHMDGVGAYHRFIHRCTSRLLPGTLPSYTFFCKNNFMATFFFVFLIYSVRNEQVSRTQIACWINLHCVRSLHHHKFQFVDCRTDFAKPSFLDLIWWLVTVQTGLITAFDAVIGLLLFVSLFIYYPRKEELIDLSTLLKTSWRW